MRFLICAAAVAAIAAAQVSGPSSLSGRGRSSRPSILLPIELMPPDGRGTTSVSVTVDLPSLANVGPTVTLRLRVHGIEFANAAGVAINGGSTVIISNRTFACSGLEATYGCLFKGLNTLWITRTISTSTLVEGPNQFLFDYGGSDGVNSGYRVLAISLLDGARELLPQAQFTNEDPANWTAPAGYTAASDIAAGQVAWSTASLIDGANQPIIAKCASCHAQDGRDLKYFNYSNRSIVTRSRFHGLSETVGNQIAAYIRNLPTKAPGRPWNPPYQPGPGLDSRDARDWSAGAGIDAVLASDQQILPYVAPTKSVADFNPREVTNMRETPISLPLLDWNHWLPTIYPGDAFPAANFAGSQFWTDYVAFRAGLIAGNPRSYDAQMPRFERWEGAQRTWINTLYPRGADVFWSTPAGARKVYSTSQWQSTKMWELMQEFDLERYCTTAYAGGESRCWPNGIPFRSSPSILQIPRGAPGIDDGSPEGHDLISSMWYHLQVVLGTGRQPICDHPVDWGYMWGFLSTMSKPPRNTPQAALLLLNMKKALQTSSNSASPAEGCMGWQLDGVAISPANSISRLVNDSDFSTMWIGYSVADRAALATAYTTSYVREFTRWPASAFIAGGFTSATEKVEPGYGDGNSASRHAFAVPRLKYIGVPDAVLQPMIDQCKRIWPGYSGWDRLLAATCRPESTGLSCSSDR